jgi:hypothetical protein
MTPVKTFKIQFFSTLLDFIFEMHVFSVKTQLCYSAHELCVSATLLLASPG